MCPGYRVLDCTLNDVVFYLAAALLLSLCLLLLIHLFKLCLLLLYAGKQLVCKWCV